MAMRKPEIYNRNSTVVAAIMGHLCGTDDDPALNEARQRAGLPHLALMDRLSVLDENPETIRRTISAMSAFGAIHQIGNYKHGNDTRVFRVTTTGVFWWRRAGELPELEDHDFDWDEPDIY